MQAENDIEIMEAHAGARTGVLSLGLVVAETATTAMMHIGRGMRNWERLNDNDDRRAKGMRQRLLYWIFQRGKNCKHCCLWCEYYDLCRADVLAQNQREDKPWKGE